MLRPLLINSGRFGPNNDNIKHVIVIWGCRVGVRKIAKTRRDARSVTDIVLTCLQYQTRIKNQCLLDPE